MSVFRTQFRRTFDIKFDGDVQGFAGCPINHIYNKWVKRNSLSIQNFLSDPLRHSDDDDLMAVCKEKETEWLTTMEIIYEEKERALNNYISIGHEDNNITSFNADAFKRVVIHLSIEIANLNAELRRSVFFFEDLKREIKVFLKGKKLPDDKEISITKIDHRKERRQIDLEIDQWVSKGLKHECFV